jgi:hypothetical protein
MNPLDRIFVVPALEGEWSLLGHHILGGGELTPAMRLLLADIIFGHRRLGKKRSSTIDPVGDVIALENEGKTTTEAINIVAGEHNVTTRTIWRALKSRRASVEARLKVVEKFWQEERAKKEEIRD